MTQTKNRYGVIGPSRHSQPMKGLNGQPHNIYDDSKGNQSLFSFDIDTLFSRRREESIQNAYDKKESFVARNSPPAFERYHTCPTVYQGGLADMQLPPRARSVSPTPQEGARSMLPRLSREHYSLSPSIEQLSRMTERQLAAVRGFRVTHALYGSVEWSVPVDVRYLQLDRLIHFQKGGVFFQSNDLSLWEQFQRLNRSATVVLFNCWPEEIQKGTVNSEYQRNMVLDRFRKTLVKQCIDNDAQFITYDGRDGSWKFNVKCFQSERKMRKQRLGA